MELHRALESPAAKTPTDVTASSYDFDVAAFDDESWCSLLKTFELGNVWQSPAYGRERWGADRIESCSLSYRGHTAIAAMIARAEIPVLNLPLAYMQFGPIWPLRHSANKGSLLREFLGQLRTHYVEENGMMLWARPREADGPDAWLTRAFEESGYVRQPFNAGRGTYKVDLRIPLEDIRTGMNRSWRRNLDRSFRQDLEFVCYEDDSGFENFDRLRRELMTRKDLLETPETNSFMTLCRIPSDFVPLETCICRFHGDPLAGIILASLGDTGISVMGATSPLARELRAGYALDWWCIQKLRREGFHWYDLGGDQTPGVNEYKAGLAGRANHIRFAGPFVAGGNALSRLAVFGTRGLIRNVERHL